MDPGNEGKRKESNDLFNITDFITFAGYSVVESCKII